MPTPAGYARSFPPLPSSTPSTLPWQDVMVQLPFHTLNVDPLSEATQSTQSGLRLRGHSVSGETERHSLAVVLKFSGKL